MRASVNCDMGEGYGLYTMGDDAALMKHIHLANVACGFHASDFVIMNETVKLAKENNVLIGAHPSLPDRQGFGRREMAMGADELAACFVYQVGALSGFARVHDMKLNHLKPHGAIYGQTARSLELAKAAVGVAQSFNLSFMGLAGTQHQVAADQLSVPFIAEWFADLNYDAEGKLIITQKHDPVSLAEVEKRVINILKHSLITTEVGTIPLGRDVASVSICVHSDTPDAVEIARTVKRLVDENNVLSGGI